MQPILDEDVEQFAPADLVPAGRLSIRFWGVRGSIATPGAATSHYGGNTSCIELRCEGQIIILDAGTGIRPAGINLARESKGRALSLTLLLSHTHWDHIQGFPFFGPAYDPKNHLRILGCKGTRDGLLTALSNQMSGYYFPVAWKQLPSSINIVELKKPKFNIGNIAVETMQLNHPGGCIGYRFDTQCGSFAYLTDVEPRRRTAKKAEHAARAAAMDPKLVGFISGVDALVMDSQYDAAEYEARIGWGHGCVDDTVAMAVEAGVKHLFLFHHDPDHDDGKVSMMVEQARGLVAQKNSPVVVDAAREGVQIVLAPNPSPANLK